MLETFELISYHSEPETQPAIQIFDDLPCLRDLDLEGASITWDKGRRFSRTTRLCLTRHRPPAMDTAQLAHVANRLPNLEQLVLQYSLTATAASPEVRFASLKRLEVTGTLSEAAAQCLRFPALEEAFLSSMRSPKYIIGHALSHSTNLSKLHLARACLSPGLADAVALLARLQELDATFCSITDDFFRRLAQLDADGKWPCPMLRRLHVAAVVPKDRETFDGTSLLALVRARRAATGVATLRDVKATWAKDMDYSKPGFQEALQQLIS